MKHVLLAIFVFFASMPLQASCGDMHASQDIPQNPHADMMDHRDMDHHDMDHGDMDMDCCDHDPMNPAGSCDQVSHCRAPASGFVAIDTSAINEVFITRQHHVTTDATPATSQFDIPPFRPPIA